MSHTKRTLIVILAAAGLVLAVAAAQAGTGVLKEGTISRVEIAVWQTSDKTEVARLDPNDTLVLDAGEDFYLRLYAPPGKGPGHQRWYLPGIFTVTVGKQQVRVSDLDVEKGRCIVTGLRPGHTAEISYEITSRRIRASKPGLKRGKLYVKVEKARLSGIAPMPEASGNTTPAQMTNRLYRGILMRDPGDSYSDFVRRIQRDGYPGVVDAAYDVVESRESQQVLARRGRGHTERLEAIYKHLLDVEGPEIDSYQWRDHLAMMSRGDVTEVVMDIVRSPEFRRVHGYQAQVLRRRDR